MTEKRTVPPSGFFMNAERAGRGMRMSLGAVVAVSELSPEKITLVSHGGRIRVSGTGLRLSVFEGRGVEIVGEISEVGFAYAKN